MLNLEDFKKNALQFLGLKDQINTLTSRQSDIKTRLLKELETVDPDDKGHRVVSFDDTAAGTVKVTRQRRVSKTLDMDVAEKLLKEKGIYDECTKVEVTLDDSKIMSALYKGQLTEEDIDSMFPEKETFAFIVDNK
jgi:hypothetical protein